MWDSSMYRAVSYIREKDCAPEDPRVHPMRSTPKCWRNRDEPRGISHTAEWTGLNGLNELTPQGRGRRQRGLGFFPLDGEYWRNGDTGERAGRRGQERDVASQGRPGASGRRGRESSRIPTTGFPPLGEVGEGVPLWGSRSRGQACAGSLQRSAQET